MQEESCQSLDQSWGLVRDRGVGRNRSHRADLRDCKAPAPSLLGQCVPFSCYLQGSEVTIWKIRKIAIPIRPKQYWAEGLWKYWSFSTSQTIRKFFAFSVSETLKIMDSSFQKLPVTPYSSQVFRAHSSGWIDEAITSQRHHQHRTLCYLFRLWKRAFLLIFLK